MIEVADTKLFVEERGAAEGFPVLGYTAARVLHVR